VGGDLLNVRADDSANKEVIFILPYRNERGFERAQYKSLLKTVNGGFDEKCNLTPNRSGVGAGFPSSSASIMNLGGENSPLCCNVNAEVEAYILSNAWRR
jgi:hypothetical protein